MFMDVEGQIKPGDDFVKVLNDQVAQCDVLLAIIGERWIGARDADGNRRLEKESDFVRIEIASALTRLPQLAHLGGVNRLIFLCPGAKGRHYRATFGPAFLRRSLGVADPAGTASIAG